MPQLVLVSEPVTSSRPALHRVPKVSNAFVKKTQIYFTLWCPFFTSTATTTANFHNQKLSFGPTIFGCVVVQDPPLVGHEGPNRPSCIKRIPRYGSELVPDVVYYEVSFMCTTNNSYPLTTLKIEKKGGRSYAT
jgi:hypothetical protein